MTPAEALADIRGFAFARRVTYSVHALERMAERGATRADVVDGLANATSCVHDTKLDRWRVECLDRDGDPLTVVVAIDDGLGVVTVF